MGTIPIIKIHSTTDAHDCETCGSSYDEGCTISLWDGDKQLWAIGADACAHCFGGSDMCPKKLILPMLEKLGYKVETSYEDLSEEDNQYEDTSNT